MKPKKIIVVLVLSILSIHGYTQNWDVDIAKNINPHNPGSGYWKFTSASTYLLSAGVPIGVLVTGILNNDPQLRRKSLEIFGTIVTEVVISQAMKVAFDRQRPGEKYPNDIFPYHTVSGRSFPSGHTSLAFAAAASLSIQCKKWYITVPAYMWAASVGFSRIYLGVHYPSDVIAGAAVGIGSAYLTHWANQKLFPVKKVHHRHTES
jgi:membrane-associated phospholipid phosphatase